MKLPRWPFAWKSTVDARDAEIARLNALKTVEEALQLQDMIIQIAHVAAERELNLTDPFDRLKQFSEGNERYV